MPPDRSPSDFYECVEPELGKLVSRLGEPDLDPDLRGRIENHVEICDACRWELELQNVVVDGLERRALRVDPRPETAGLLGGIPKSSLIFRSLCAAGGTVLAASLTLMLVLAPEAPNGDLIPRAGSSELRFVRPVESEVVLGGRPRLSWSSLPDAVMYRVTLRAVDGTYTWSDSTRATHIRVPTEAAVPRSMRLRAFVEPVPPDLAPPRGSSVSFRTGGLGGFLGHRLRAAPIGSRVAGLVGGILVLTALVVRFRSRRS